jgi:GTP-binding protein LepA
VETDLVKVDILLNGKSADPLASLVHRAAARDWGVRLAGKLREVIHRQLYEVVIQAAVGNKILCRERLAPLRKDVTAKCYGGDQTRKRKLLDKQKAGKKRMRSIGNVELSQEAFFSVLKD